MQRKVKNTNIEAKRNVLVKTTDHDECRGQWDTHKAPEIWKR
jgi:hypothetical protein